MKKLRVMLLCCMLLCTVALEISPSMAGQDEGWGMEALDRLGALPNDPSPPVQRTLQQKLPPLPPSMEGTVRRVDVGREKVVALTFDLCELATNTTGCDMEILSFLHQTQTPATLFMGGKWMRTHAARVMQIMREPCFEIGSHAWTHGNFGIMNEAAMREQVEWTQAEYARLRAEALKMPGRQDQNAPEIAPVPLLFRLPYGRCSDKALALLAAYGLQVIQWDVVAEMETDNAIPAVAEAAIQQIRPGSIVLMHANCVPKGTAVLVRHLIHGLSARGYRFVKVSELLRMGKPERVREGYFTRPGDNLSLDKRFGVDGTGRQK